MALHWLCNYGAKCGNYRTLIMMADMLIYLKYSILIVGNDLFEVEAGFNG